MMTCREMVDFLMAYVEAELPTAQREAFEAHLGACPECEVYLEQYRETVRLGRAVCDDPDGPVPSEVPDALVNAILRARRSES